MQKINFDYMKADNMPKEGECWTIETWSPQCIDTRVVLIVGKTDLAESEYGAQVDLFQCLSEKGMEWLPQWAFNAGKLLNV